MWRKITKKPELDPNILYYKKFIFHPVQKPMDMGTVKRKLDNQEYRTIGEFKETKLF